MKTAKIIGVVFLIMILSIGGIGIYQYNKNNSSVSNSSEEIVSKSEAAKEVLELNSLAVSASGEKVSSIDIPDSCSDTFGEKVTAYKVESHKYSSKEIRAITKVLKTDVKEEEKIEQDIEIYQLKNGGYMEYYEESGALSYIGATDSEVDMKNLKKEIDETKCKKVADEFISETGIIKASDLEYVSTDVCETIETGDGTYPLTYQIYYTKKSPEGSEGFYGVGPGIKIEIDKAYTIRTFLSVDKDVKKISGTYATISEEKAIDKIYKGDGVQIDGSSEGKMGVAIDNVNLYLYCDPIAQKQTYMAPYYIMDGEDEKGKEITIAVPAVDDSMIKYVN